MLQRELYLHFTVRTILFQAPTRHVYLGVQMDERVGQIQSINGQSGTLWPSPQNCHKAWAAGSLALPNSNQMGRLCVCQG